MNYKSRMAKFKKKLKLTPTPSELKFRELLKENGIKHIFQKGFCSKGRTCIVDFYLPKPMKCCIELDGGYHFTPEQKYKDHLRNTYLTQTRHFKLIRAENEIAITKFKEIMETIPKMKMGDIIYFY